MSNHTAAPLGMINGILHIPASEAPAQEALSTVYRDTLSREGNCPGFYLWAAEGDDGVWYLMAGDHAGGVETRLYFRTRGAGGNYPPALPSRGPVSRVTRIAYLGENPNAADWDALRATPRR